jgi:hypothetical protein
MNANQQLFMTSLQFSFTYPAQDNKVAQSLAMESYLLLGELDTKSVYNSHFY